MRIVAVCLLGLIGFGCNSPSFRDCEVRCTAASGCPDDFACNVEGRCRPVGAAGSCSDVPGVRQEVLAIRARPNRELDLLFVIDDSAAMTEKQVVVGAAIPALLEELSALDGNLPSLHVGAITTDHGTKGSNNASPAPAIGQIGNGGCAGLGDAGFLQKGNAQLTGQFLRDLEGPPRTTNYTGTLDAAISQLIRLGSAGCGFEQPLHSLRTALTNTVENAGFLRAGAGLAVIVVGDEDDCSVLDPGLFGPESVPLGALQSFRCFEFGVQCEPDDPRTVGAKSACKPRATSTLIEDIAPFRSFLTALKPDPRDVMFGVLAGATTPVGVELRAPPQGGPLIPGVIRTCNYPLPQGATVADPPLRLAELVRTFPGRGHLESICSDNLAPQLRSLARTARGLIGDPCLVRAVADRSPELGLQPDCIVEDVRGQDAVELPACRASGETDCFELVADPALCLDHDHLKLVVRRSAPAPADAFTVVRCAVPG